MKSGKITACTFKKSFNSQHGTLYSHAITLDNGDSGEINAKEENPSFLAAGQTLWYEAIPNGKYAPKIKRMKAPDGAQSEQSEVSNDKGKDLAISTIAFRKAEALEKEIADLKEVVKQLVKHTKLVYVNPKKPMPSPATVTTLEDDMPF